MKDEGTGRNYRCEIDTAAVAEEQESAALMADGNTLSLLLLKMQNKHLDTKPERKYEYCGLGYSVLMR